MGWILYPKGNVVPGKELAVIPDSPSGVAVVDPPSLELRRFEDKVHRVLCELVEDVRDDPGHAFSQQYESVARRKLERAVERFEEGS